MKRQFFSIIFILGCLVASACTSAIVTGKMTANGRPLLWKHRDTSDLNNKVERISSVDGYDFVGLFNASDTLCREAWMGCNVTGFAIMNTASYNLKADSVKEMDKEGLVMSIALAKCKTVDDFETLLKALPKPLGVEANFGVIDANGGAAYFETCNYSYTRFDVDSVMVRTNHSKSGRKDEGYGYVREQTAITLLTPYIKNRNITPATFTETLSRSFYHSLIDKDFAADSVEYVVDRDFIPRRISSASVVVEGVNPGEDSLMTTMWTVLGYPPCGVVTPVWLFDGGLPKDVQADAVTFRAPACDKANELKKQVFDIKRDNGSNYLNIKALYKDDGSGISQINNKISIENYRKGYELLKERFDK